MGIFGFVGETLTMSSESSSILAAEATLAWSSAGIVALALPSDSLLASFLYVQFIARFDLNCEYNLDYLSKFNPSMIIMFYNPTVPALILAVSLSIKCRWTMQKNLFCGIFCQMISAAVHHYKSTWEKLRCAQSALHSGPILSKISGNTF